MKINQKYSKDKLSNHYDTIIIGSGISGLTCAAFLGMHGKKVLVLEKHFKIGGWTHTFKRKGYEWDVGIHYIGGVHLKKTMSRRILDKISDNKLKWNKMTPNYDRIIFPDKSYNFIAPKEEFIKQLINYFPEEEKAILKYVDLVDKANKVSLNYFMSKTLSGISEFLFYKTLTKKFFKYSDKTTYEVLSSITSNKKLIGVLTGQWGDHGLTPKESSFMMHSLIVSHYFDGGNYPVGGCRQIAETIVPFIRKNNGDLFVDADVKKINIESNKATGITLENGDIINAKTIISSAGIVNTLQKFIKNNGSFNTSLLKKIKPTESYICLHIGINGSTEDLGLKDTNFWVYPDYDHDKNVQDSLKSIDNKFPVVYISFPSVKDPNWDKEHPGKSAMEAITFSSISWFEKWSELDWKKRGEEYEKLKEELSNRLLEVVYKHVPSIKGKVDYFELSTPLSTRDLANYPKGEMYGIEHGPDRFKQKWLKPKTPIKNLYLTGQDVTTVGFTSALFSGLLTSSVILKKNLTKNL